MKKIIFMIFLMISSLGFSQGAAPTPPARNASDVITVFSGAGGNYTEVGSDFYPDWGQGTQYEQVALGGNMALHYTNLDFQGVQFNSPINASTMTKLHLDIWTPDVSPFNVYLIAGGENAVTLTPTLSGWNSFDIDLSQYSSAGRTLNNIIQFKFEKPNFAYHAETNSIYLDNIYFWKPANIPTLSNFSIATKASGSAPFTITAPTSNSSGAFTYTSSNTSVATVSGNTITITGVGQTIISATQAAAGSFASGSITTTFDVTPPAAPTPTIPVANILGLYTDVYPSSDIVVSVDTFLTSWSAATLTPIVISSNNTLKYTNVNFLGIETTSSPINATGMNLFHIDVFTPNMTTFRVKLVDFGADGVFGGGDDKEHELSMTPTLNGWNSYNLLLSDFTGLTTRAHIAQVILSGNPAGSGTLYVDNIYFGNQAISVAPTLSNFVIPAKNTGDANFTITPPTSTSPGSFTYTSSNTAVATVVSGNTIHVVGVGTTTITATQAASGNYLSGSITASLVVTVPLAQSPTTAAPAPPSRNAWDVVSVFSGAYTNIADTNFFPDWGQGTTYEQITLGSPANATLHYSNLDYEGINLVPDGNPGINVLTMTKLHLDVWTPNVSPFAISLIAGGENAVTLTPTVSGWNSFDIDLTQYSSQGRTLGNVIQLKIEKPGFAYHAETNSIYFDNIYFWRPTTSLPSPTITNFSVPSKVLGNAPFVLTAPTSNSAGSFTYTSSNTSVATISGSTVTIVGAGTSVITATQAGTSTYGSGTITANLVVSFPPPTTAAPTPTVPADRVLSLFSNAYSNLVGTDFFPNWGQSTVVSDIQVVGNDTKKYEFLNYEGMQLANPIDVSSMTTLHVDIWTPNCTTFEVYLINTTPSTVQQSVSLSPTTSGWNSFDIPLSQYSNIALNNVGQLMFVGTPSGSSTVYMDNLYFTKPTPTAVAPTVTSVVNLCKGSATAPLTAAGFAGNALKWYSVVGTTYTLLTAAPSPATSTVASPYKVYAVSQVLSNGTESPKATITVNVNAIPVTPGAITGTAAQGLLVGTLTPATYSITDVVGAASYIWTAPTGVTIVSGQGTTNVVVNFNGVAAGAGAIGSLSVQAVNAAGCNSVAKALALTKALPAAPASIVMTDGVTTTAIKSFAKYMGTATVLKLTAATAATATSYDWELPVGVNRTDGTGTNSTTPYIYVNFLGVTNVNTFSYLTAAATPVLTNVLRFGVKSRNGVGVSTTSNAALVNPTTTSTGKLLTLTAILPAVVKTVTGQIAGICGGSTYSYTITDSALASAYLITAPAGSVVKSAGHSSNATNVLTTSDLTFSVKYPSGFLVTTTTATADKSIVITSVNGMGNSVTNKSITLSTAMAAVASIGGGTTYSSCNQTFTTPAVLGATSYTWTVPAGASIVSGQGSNTVVVNYGSLAGTQTIKVIATNSCGISSAIKSVNLTAGVCPGSKQSEPSLVSLNEINMYPNPARDQFNVELNASIDGDMEMTIYSITGAILNSKIVHLTEGINVINEDVSTLASGTYFVRFNDATSNETTIKKLIKE